MKFLSKLEDGFVLIMSLLVLPVFLGFGLLLIDIGRGNNAHADLQTVVDALALTGARELDGTSGAMTNAQNAMTELTNPVGMLSYTGTTTTAVTYAAGDTRFEVVFLDDIPTNDTDPITEAWKTNHAASTDDEAEYLYVRAYSRSDFSLELIFEFLSFFQAGADPVPGRFPLGAVAVAQARSSICDIPPLFICNPFEYVGGTYDPDELQDRFNAGDLHGRLIRLHPGGGTTAFPGNFGFLAVGSSPGTNTIRDYFAGGGVPLCYGEYSVDTAPGSRDAAADGINIRFDIMPGPNYDPDDPITDPVDGYYAAIAENVRKGYIPQRTGPPSNYNYNDCVPVGAGAADWGDDHIMDDPSVGWRTDGSGNIVGLNGVDDGVYGFPDNDAMQHPGTSSSATGVPGAYIGTSSAWNLQKYLDVNYNTLYGTSFTPSTVPSSFPGLQASRYDVYRWEIDDLPALLSRRSPGNGSDGGEVGLPNCSTSDYARTITSITDINPDEDPRVLAAAVVDCGELNVTGGGSLTDVRVNTYASIFLARPMLKWYPSADQTIDVEIIDIAGFGGNGTLETFVRDEAELVR